MATVRSALAKAYSEILANIDEVIFDTYLKEKPVHKSLYNIKKTNLPIVRSEGFTGLGYFELKNEAEEGASDNIHPMFTKAWTPYTYSLLVEFSREAISDDRLGVVKKASEALGSSAVYTQDILAANILNTAFSTTGPDGKVLCATDHVLYNGTMRNRPTNGMALTRTSLALALVDWMDEQKNDRGIKIEIDPAYLVVPAALMLDAAEILKSTERPDTANRAINVINSDFNIQPVTWKRITDSKMWFLMAKPAQHHIMVYVREGFHTLHGVDDKAGSAWTRGEFRQDVGYSAPQGIYGSPGLS